MSLKVTHFTKPISFRLSRVNDEKRVEVMEEVPEWVFQRILNLDLCRHTGGHSCPASAKTMRPVEASAAQRANPDEFFSDCPKQWSNHPVTQPSVRGSWLFALTYCR